MNAKKQRIVAVLLALGLLTGCGGGADNAENESAAAGQAQTEVKPSAKLNQPPEMEQIVYDLNNFGVEALAENTVEVTSCELIKRQTNEENKEDITYVRAICEPGYGRFEYQFKLLYTYYDVGGWILDEVTPEKPEEWTQTYYDADGNDLMESIVWLDWLEMDDFYLKGDYYGEYLNKCDDTYYIAVPAKTFYHVSNPNELTGNVGEYWIYNDRGEQLIDNVVNFRNTRVQYAFTNSNGEPRLILNDRDAFDGRGANYVADEYFLPLSDLHWSIAPPSEGTCIIHTVDNCYGAIDLDGNLVIPPQYTTSQEVVKKLGRETASTSASGSETVIEYVDGESFTRADGTSVLNLDYQSACYVGGQEMIAVYEDVKWELIWDNKVENGTFRLFDHNGRARSPKFEHIAEAYEYRLISYNGRVGILPDILTEEEQNAVSYKRIADKKYPDYAEVAVAE